MFTPIRRADPSDVKAARKALDEARLRCRELLKRPIYPYGALDGALAD
jgi:hypothetical protein